MKVLIVDDLEINRKVLRALLQSEGIAVVEAGDGEEAFALLAANKVDAVISDILMPNMDGYILCQQMRADPLFREIPVIMYTATYLTPSDADLALKMGADVYLKKPAGAADLIAAMNKVIEARKSGSAKPPMPVKEAVILKQYNQVLIKKLEEKNIQLQENSTALAASNEILRATAERLRLATESAGLGVWDLDLEENTLVWDARMYEIYGLRPGEFGSAYEAWQKGVHPEDRAAAHAEAQAAMAGKRGFHTEFRVVWPDGTVRHIEAHAMLKKGPGGASRHMVGVNRDITARRKAEADLVLLKTAIEQSREVICITDAQGAILFVNPAFEAASGYSRQEVAGKNPRIFQSGKHDEAFYRDFWRTISSGRAWTGRWINKRRDGALYLMDSTVSPVRDAAGRIVSYVAVARDVTEQGRTEERQKLLRKLIDHASDGIEVIEPGTLRLLDVNWKSCEDLGYAREELLKMTIRDIDPATGPAVVEPRMRQMEKSGFVLFEAQHRRKDGSLFPVEVSLTRVELERSYLVATVRDITARKRGEEERKNLQAQLAQSQKMDSVGRLAGGVAHDFNNLLTVILGLTELSLKDMPAAHPLRGDLAEIKAAAVRAAKLTQQLLAFSRRQIIAPEVLDLGELVVNIDKMLRRIIGEDIAVTLTRAPCLWLTRVDAGQIEQVLVNLCVNARDAMPAGGDLSIATSNVALDRDWALSHPGATAGDFVRLAVRDNGAGMTAEVKRQIFEPFFTTKPKDKGTGLGLATCYGIVKQSGGYLSVDSEPGQGATFSVYLPRTLEAAAKPVAAAGPAGLPRGAETLLIVEDEAAVRRLLARMLRLQGYTVLEAAGAEEALKLARSDAKRALRLMITDVVMPKGDGKLLAKALHEMRPDVRVIYTSGYADDAIVRHGRLEPGIAFLPKPYNLEVAARKVREVLDSAQGDQA